MFDSESPELTPGQIWGNHAGREVEVLHLCNLHVRGPQKPAYPDIVCFRRLSDGKVLALRLKIWRRLYRQFKRLVTSTDIVERN